MTVTITGTAAVVAPAQTSDWFDPAAHLGKRGWKYLSPATRYLLAAANQAVGRRHDSPLPDSPPAERLGVVTGTQYAIAGVHRRMDHTLRTDGVGAISPAEVPAFSMNTPGSQLAITLGARAFSVTLTNPGTAGLEAVLFAASALRTGRADRVVATATEQVPEGLGHDGAAAVVLSTSPGPVSVTGGFSRFVTRASADLSARRIASLGAEVVLGGPPAAAELVEALCGALRNVGVRPRLTTARHCAVSGLVDLVELAGAGGPAVVVSVSEYGHLAVVAITS